ncbi:MAG: DUF1552 domain-containing protein [Deltaproteobacteria bacterium]|nr:DUF1552 domain-containing protein [Deltaproteobacteria bacterium]MCB9789190.1 DUF1552 domain-containing protein [Deltaproteobacteria bacterium]
MTGPRITRRTLLKGIFGGAVVSLALPPLEIFMNSHGTAYADEGGGFSGFPRRFGLFWWGNGVLPDRWAPLTTGAEWEPSVLLEPLRPWRDRVTVVTGTALGVTNSRPHGAGAAGLLTGRELIEPYGANTFASASLDQVIAQAIGDSTPYPSLEVGALSDDSLSYNGPNSRNPAESDPIALYQRLFGPTFTLPGEDPIIDPTLALRRSILDAVSDDLKRLQSRVGAADKTRLDQHFDGLRSLEKRLAKLEQAPPVLAACERPEQPLDAYPDIEGRPQLAAKNRATCDIVAMALACDLTRVFSNWFTEPVSNPLFPGAPAGHHQLTHDEPGEQLAVQAILVQIMESFAYQVESLARIEEGDGTLLDSMAVLGTSEISLGKTHALDDFPLLIAGSAGGRLREGIHHASTGGEKTGKVTLSLLRAMGVEAASWGDEGGYADSGMSAIEV